MLVTADIVETVFTAAIVELVWEASLETVVVSKFIDLTATVVEGLKLTAAFVVKVLTLCKTVRVSLGSNPANILSDIKAGSALWTYTSVDSSNADIVVQRDIAGEPFISTFVLRSKLTVVMKSLMLNDGSVSRVLLQQQDSLMLFITLFNPATNEFNCNTKLLV